MKVQKTLQRFCSFFLLALLVSIGARAAGNCDGSGNCYVRAGATGTGTGANWTNACTGFTGACDVTNSALRGTTLWVAVGSYGSPTFSAADSGTSVITIEAATTANHGPASDWSSSYAGQAVFGGGTSISTDYWTFTGQSWGSACSGLPVCNVDAAYNILFHNTTGVDPTILITGSRTNHHFDHVDLYGYNTANTDDDGLECDSACNYFYFGYGYIHETGGNPILSNNGQTAGSGCPHTYEYDYIYKNHMSKDGTHAEAFSETSCGLTARYSVFQDICSSGVITTASAGNASMNGRAFYGNIVFWDATYAANNGSGQLATLDDSVLDFLGEVMSGTVYFVNNTIAGIYSTVATQTGVGFSSMPIGGDTYSTGTPIVIEENNLWYASAWTGNDYSPYCGSVSCATGTVQDYDAFFVGSIPSSVFSNPTETHGYTVSTASTNPFTNYSSFTVAGFQLATPDPFSIYAGSAVTNAGTYYTGVGTTMATNTFNVDMYGTTRGADGIWDRGALQISGTSSTAPNPPSGLTATVQ